jgi:DNA modification methylase
MADELTTDHLAAHETAPAGGRQLALRQDELDAIAAQIQAGQPIDERYRTALFHSTREAELTYTGKATAGSILAQTMAVPLQVHKRFGDPDAEWADQLVLGDNLQVLRKLLDLKRDGLLRNADGSLGVRCCYIDPPFATKREFRGRRGAFAYRDKVEGAEFVEYLRKRLVLIHELLAEDGSLYLHLDTNKVHYLKVVLDEIFTGPNHLIAEIVWKRTSAHGDAQRWAPVHETILAYAKDPETFVWNRPREPLDPAYAGKKYTHDDGNGRGKYRLDNITSPNPRPNMTYEWQGFPPPEKGWRYSRATMDELDADRRIHKPADKTMRPQLKRYFDENEGQAVDDLWTDIPPVNSQATDRIGYPTQKPVALLERILTASTNPGDIVLDCFAGSGTTAVAARALDRRWVAVDCGKLAIYTAQRRLLGDGDGAPFEVCHAGLYDNALLEQLPPEGFRAFTLDLFGCKPEDFSIAGVPMAGRRKGDPVHVFPFDKVEGDLDEGYIDTLHQRIGSQVDQSVYVIVPEARCDPGMFQDVVEHGATRYFLLRVPYSVIELLHERDFQLTSQPSALNQVNDALDAYGFDFIEPPEVDLTVDPSDANLSISIDAFRRGGLDPDDAPALDDAGRGDLAMVLVDDAYGPPEFRLAEHHFGETLHDGGWTFKVDHKPGATVMLVFIDIFGNELRLIVRPGASAAEPAADEVTA